MANFPTRNNNILDVVLINCPSLAIQYVRMPDLSDHNIVFVETNSCALRHKPAWHKIVFIKNEKNMLTLIIYA